MTVHMRDKIHRGKIQKYICAKIHFVDLLYRLNTF